MWLWFYCSVIQFCSVFFFFFFSSCWQFQVPHSIASQLRLVTVCGRGEWSSKSKYSPGWNIQLPITLEVMRFIISILSRVIKWIKHHTRHKKKIQLLLLKVRILLGHFWCFFFFFLIQHRSTKILADGQIVWPFIITVFYFQGRLLLIELSHALGYLHVVHSPFVCYRWDFVIIRVN